MKSRVFLIVLVVVLVVLAVSTGAFSRMRGGDAAVAGTDPVVGVVASATETRQREAEAPRQVLAQWDQRRAEAWAAGSVSALRALYTARSAAGRVDVAMLRAWLRKGLRVDGMQTQMLSFAVVSRTRSSMVVDVVDRLSGGSAVGRGDELALPADAADSRRITLVRVEGEWLVSSVR